MANRFLTKRHVLDHPHYSRRRMMGLLNDWWARPHKMRPYGTGAGKLHVANMFERNGTRPGNRRVKRVPKKHVRQEARRQLHSPENTL